MSQVTDNNPLISFLFSFIVLSFDFCLHYSPNKSQPPTARPMHALLALLGMSFHLADSNFPSYIWYIKAPFKYYLLCSTFPVSSSRLNISLLSFESSESGHYDCFLCLLQRIQQPSCRLLHSFIIFFSTNANFFNEQGFLLVSWTKKPSVYSPMQVPFSRNKTSLTREIFNYILTGFFWQQNRKE